ncbi:hypothetical protein F5144DRAFT_588972 [Chaetomium tenue]|uniref:Uncharacterized protein n=1 Tax=Chaetomium tenue TaxID=1854479 RepID=A0ACB7PN41_9PEZI|nr:hypothetical protein F5144DRAFT_588972 [Chaetomium globosum]
MAVGVVPQPAVRDTLSLRPRGFYSYAFLATRITQIICLAVITGIIGHFIHIVTRGRQPAPVNLIVVILFTAAALIWTLFSWTGYSRRYLAYAATWGVDLVFLIPFVALAIVLGLPMADSNCAAVAANGKFEITAPPGSSVGRVAFPADGRASCLKLFVVWVLLIAVSVFFALSALSVGFLHLGDKQLEKAIFAPKEDPRGGSGSYYDQGMNDSRGRGFAPTPRAYPGPGEGGVYGYNNSQLRPSISEDRLNLNRPVTVAPARAGNRAFAGGPIYEEPLGQPAAARMPRMHPDEAYDYSGSGRGGWRKPMSSNESRHDNSPGRPAGLGNVTMSSSRPAGLGNMTMSSARGQPQGPNMRPNIDKVASANGDGFIPDASFAPQLASLSKAPISNKAAPMIGAADRKNGRQESSQDDRQDFGDVTPTGLSPHESLIPKPLTVRGNGTSARQGVREKSAESGWWGALDSVISRPQAEYDPSNVL